MGIKLWEEKFGEGKKWPHSHELLSPKGMNGSMVLPINNANANTKENSPREHNNTNTPSEVQVEIVYKE